MALLGPHIHPATSALQRMTIRLSSGTSSKCHGLSRTLSWPTQPRERSTTCSGHRLSPTGLPSATTTAWRYSECSVGGAMPTRQGLTFFPPLPHPKVRRNMFPVVRVSFIALHPLLPEVALGVLGQLPHCSLCQTQYCVAPLSPGLSFKIFSLFLFFFSSSIKSVCIFVCQPLC